jgi:hypothetical protein
MGMRNGLGIHFLVLFLSVSAKAQQGISPEDAASSPLAAQNAAQENCAQDSCSRPIDKPCGVALVPALTAKEKLAYTFKTAYGLNSIAASLAGSGIKQARDSVPEWGQGMSGYGKRFGSSLGQKAIKQSIRFGLGTLLHEDPRHFSSGRQGIWRRTLYAASRSFVSTKDGGGIRPGYSKFAAAFGGAYLSRQWYPESKQNVREYLSSGGISIGLDAAKNVFHEFWPDLKKRLKH